jgi:hypothetical protein
MNTHMAKRLQKRVEDLFYGDTAAVLTHTVSALNGYGQPTVTETSTSISCSFTDKPFEFEKWRDYGDVESVIAQVRFTSPAPSKGNRLTISARFEDGDYVDKTYEIVGIMDRGTMGYLCDLKAVAV